jgi:uncharacterized protein
LLRNCDNPLPSVATVTVRFYAELNDHLAPELRFTPFTLPLGEDATVAGLLASAGVPLSEVDLVLHNGEPARCEDHVASGDRLSVYPVFETFDIGSTQRLRSRPLRAPAFVLDVHLGKLAAFLRMFGCDASYATSLSDEQLVRISLEERRVLLSKDRALLQDTRLERAYAVRAGNTREQLLEVVRRFDLAGSAKPFTRCLHCNTLLVPVAKEAVLDRIPPRVQERCDQFTTCVECQRVFWKGTHYTRMVAFIAEVLREARNAGVAPLEPCPQSHLHKGNDH